MATHNVICPYCHQTFNRDKEPFIQLGRRYAHPECHQKAESQKTQDEKDLQDLEEYILKLLNLEYITPRIRKLINDYKEKNNYSYTGIRKALYYFYEIQKNPIEKANGSIGIVPYIWDEAYRYYYDKWERDQKNDVEIINKALKPQDIIIKIPPPERTKKKRRLFSFLDEK